jgi:hypothetical protein
MASLLRKLGSVNFYSKLGHDLVERADNFYRPLIHQGR